MSEIRPLSFEDLTADELVCWQLMEMHGVNDNALKLSRLSKARKLREDGVDPDIMFLYPTGLSQEVPLIGTIENQSLADTYVLAGTVHRTIQMPPKLTDAEVTFDPVSQTYAFVTD